MFIMSFDTVITQIQISNLSIILEYDILCKYKTVNTCLTAAGSFCHVLFSLIWFSTSVFMSLVDFDDQRQCHQSLFRYHMIKYPPPTMSSWHVGKCYQEAKLREMDRDWLVPWYCPIKTYLFHVIRDNDCLQMATFNE